MLPFLIKTYIFVFIASIQKLNSNDNFINEPSDVDFNAKRDGMVVDRISGDHPFWRGKKFLNWRKALAKAFVSLMTQRTASRKR